MTHLKKRYTVTNHSNNSYFEIFEVTRNLFKANLYREDRFCNTRDLTAEQVDTLLRFFINDEPDVTIQVHDAV